MVRRGPSGGQIRIRRAINGQLAWTLILHPNVERRAARRQHGGRVLRVKVSARQVENLSLPCSVPLLALAFGAALHGVDQDAAQAVAAFEVGVHNFKANFIDPCTA